MRRSTIFTLFLSLVFFPFLAGSQETQIAPALPESYPATAPAENAPTTQPAAPPQRRRARPGFFTGLGGIFGYETNDIQQIGGGLATQTGYRFNDQWSLLLEADMFFTSKSGVDYVAIPFILTPKFNFWEGAFASAGFGYFFLASAQGRQFGGSTLIAERTFNGFTGDVAGGYDFWVSERVCISPQAGFNFAHISNHNLFTPNLRVNLNYTF